MAGRYVYEHRKKGDVASASPEALDVGKKLLGYLAEQRRLSGVKTLSIQRQAPDGSTVIARFVGDLPEVQIFAPPAIVGGRKVIALRMVAYLLATVGATTRIYRAVVELDRFDADTFERIVSPRSVLWWSFAGTGSPRALYALVSPSAQPYVADAASSPKTAAFSINNVFGLFDITNPDVPAIGAVQNSLWSAIYGASISAGTETYVEVAALPSGNLMMVGYAREATPSIPKLPDALLLVDKTTLQVTSGRQLTDVFGAGVSVSTYRGFQASPASEHAFVALSSGLYKLAPDLTVVASLGIPALGFAFARDGQTAFVYGNDSGNTVFTVVDPNTMTAMNSVTLPSLSAWGTSNVAPKIAVGADNVYCLTQDGDGPCFEVRRQSDLGFVRRVPLDAVVPLTTANTAPSLILGPGEKRIYFHGVVSGGFGGVAIVDAVTGELLDEFNATVFKQSTGDPLSVIAAALPRTYYLSR